MSYPYQANNNSPLKNLLMSLAYKIVPVRRHFGLSNYEETFIQYLRVGFNKLTKAEQGIILNANQVRGNQDIGFAIPPDWESRIWKLVTKYNPAAQDFRTRTTSSDRIIQPSTTTNTSDEGSKPGRIVSSANTDGSNSRRREAIQRAISKIQEDGEFNSAEALAREDLYSEVVIPFVKQVYNFMVGGPDKSSSSFIRDTVIDYLSRDISYKLGLMAFSLHKDAATSSMLQSTYNLHESEGFGTVAGYLPVTNIRDTASVTLALQKMLGHLPEGYKQNAKWYMSKETALWLGAIIMRTEGSMTVYLDPEYEENTSQGIPMRFMYNKPVVIVKNMPDYLNCETPVILGDLSRAYIMGKNHVITIKKLPYVKEVEYKYPDEEQVSYKYDLTATWKMSGQVLQPAAFKFLRIIDEFKNTSQVEDSNIATEINTKTTYV